MSWRPPFACVLAQILRYVPAMEFEPDAHGVMVDAGKEWVARVLSGWFPVIQAWWWRRDRDFLTLHAEGTGSVAPTTRTFTVTLMKRCGEGDNEARRRARASLETLLCETVNREAGFNRPAPGEPSR